MNRPGINVAELQQACHSICPFITYIAGNARIFPMLTEFMNLGDHKSIFRLYPPKAHSGPVILKISGGFRRKTKEDSLTYQQKKRKKKERRLKNHTNDMFFLLDVILFDHNNKHQDAVLNSIMICVEGG